LTTLIDFGKILLHIEEATFEAWLDHITRVQYFLKAATPASFFSFSAECPSKQQAKHAMSHSAEKKAQNFPFSFIFSNTASALASI
jgi:hypothetical protein